VRPQTLDHVALWVAERDPIADFVTAHLGMHVIERTDKFTLVGSDARRGKLTLFEAEGPRERGALKHIALRVSDLRAAIAELPENLAVEQPREGEAYFDLSEGLRLGLVEGQTDVDYDLDHAALFSRNQTATFVELHEGDPGEPERPLLNHLAVLVDSAEEHISEAEELGVEIDDVVDAPNTYAVFLWGPERVRVEYVEHKASFSLT